jgi:OmpA-OmpF porin, OOP family
MRKLHSILVLTAAVLCSAGARAQQASPRFDIEVLTLDPAAADSLVVNARTLEKGVLRLGLGVQYQRRPLLLEAGSATLGAIVSDRIVTNLLGAYAFTDRLELSGQVPIISWQQGDDLSLYGAQKIDSSGMGNPRLGLRYALLRPGTLDGWNLAAKLDAILPFGSPASLGNSGSDGIAAEPSLSVSKGLGGVVVAAVQAGVVVKRTQAIDTRRIGSAFNGAASLGLQNEWHPELVARTGFPFQSGVPGGFEALFGLRHALFDSEVEGFGMVGGGVGSMPGQPVFRALLGLGWRPHLGQAKEVIVEKPVEKIVERIVEKPAVCAAPPPPADLCAPGGIHKPEQCPDNDDDGDGIVNSKDRCPLEKGPAVNDGCPAVDRDGDGVADVEDLCPDVPGPAANMGCPILDRDGDGVPDNVDNCPDVKGTAENHGCPAEAPQKVTILRERVSRVRTRIKLALTLNFETGKSDLAKESYALLDNLAQVIDAHPELKGLRVEGHTDDRGDAGVNKRLSEARAKAVRAYLEKKGVQKGRLDARGYGQERPLEKNDTDEQRARNRRVEVVSADEVN